LLAQHESPPLADAVRDINKFSNNVMARQVFLTLGNDTAPATAERSRQRIADWLNARGLRFAELDIENGSGLSRRERISADSLNRLLLDAWKNPVMPEFISSMPIVGIDGTMKKRLSRLRRQRPRPYQDRHARRRQDRRRLRAGRPGPALRRHLLHQSPARPVRQRGNRCPAGLGRPAPRRREEHRARKRMSG
jgi:hypothetical protein